jgi:RNA polymerase sigma factor (sigma-70 family)
MCVTTAAPPARDAGDDALISMCLAGDDAGWSHLVNRYGRLVEAVIRKYHLPREEQADIFQDTWMELWRQLPSLRDHERLASWLITIAGRLAWDARKKLIRRDENGPSRVLLESLVDDDDGPELTVARKETSEQVRAALILISPRCRVLLRALFYDDSMSYADVAAQLGCSPNSIGPIRGRCFKELHAALGAVRAERRPYPAAES